MPTESRAAGILLTHGDRGLFLKRAENAKDHAGEWCCPGGSIEGGEIPEQAAARELTEETGLVSGDLNQIDDGDGFVTFRQTVDAESDPTLNEEHTEYRWAPLSDPPQPLHPGVAATLKKLLGGAALDKREYDSNGWFEVSDNPLSTVGVYPYSEASVIKGGDRNKLVGVYRPAEELSDPETVKSFQLMPWTDDHPSSLLGDASQDLVPAEQKGVHGVIGEQTYFRDGTLYGNIKVFSEQLARKVAAGKRELSCGYRCDFIPQEGVYEGTPYQYVQKNLRGNHVASVKEGRMGSSVRVLDAAERFTFSLDMKDGAVRPILSPPNKDGLFVQPGVSAMGAERERYENDRRNAFANHFKYADPFTGIQRTYDPKGDYNCGRCNQADGNKCLLVDIKKIDPAAGSCGDWEDTCAGDTELVLHWKSPAAAGYGVAANGIGFGCHRCPFASRAIEKDSRGRDLYCGKMDARVFGNACCVLNGAPVLASEAQDSTELATTVAGASDAEKVTTNGHQSINGDTPMAAAIDAKAKDGEVKDPAGGKEDPKKDGDLAGGSKDAMSDEEEAGMDAAECAKDAEEEKADKDKDDKEARDRKSARDRRAGARDGRKSARDKYAARDAKARDAKAKDADKDDDKKDKGMDASEITILVRKEIASGSQALDAAEIVKLAVAQVVPAIRKEEAAKASLYGRISPIIGAFDHAEMTHTEMASYGLKKLGAPEAKDSVTALDFYLAGRTQVVEAPARRAALDSSDESFVGKYLNS